MGRKTVTFIAYLFSTFKQMKYSSLHVALCLFYDIKGLPLSGRFSKQFTSTPKIHLAGYIIS